MLIRPVKYIIKLGSSEQGKVSLNDFAYHILTAVQMY